MKEHKKHKHHPHDMIAAMSQFKEREWEKKVEDVIMADTKYSSEMGQEEEYRADVNALSAYARKHKMKY